MEAFIPPIQNEYDDGGDQLMTSLTILSKVVKLLDIPDASFYNYSSAITRLVTRDMGLWRSLQRLKAVEEQLIDHLSSLKHENRLISHWNDVLTPGSSSSMYPEGNATLDRRKEALVKKAKEYQRALDKLMAEENVDVSVTVTQYFSQRERNLNKQRELKEKRSKLKTFQGLPPNLDLARHELNLARQRQMKLIQLREHLLARMAESVS